MAIANHSGSINTDGCFFPVFTSSIMYSWRRWRDVYSQFNKTKFNGNHGNVLADLIFQKKIQYTARYIYHIKVISSLSISWVLSDTLSLRIIPKEYWWLICRVCQARKVSSCICARGIEFPFLRFVDWIGFWKCGYRVVFFLYIFTWRLS
jgi:hypothetical protein